MSLLRNLNTLVEILLGPTDLLESNEAMTFSISALSVGLTEKEIIDPFLRKSEIRLCKTEVLSLVLLAIKEKYLLKIFWDCNWIGNSGTTEMFLIVEIDFKPCIYFGAVPVGFKIMIVVVLLCFKIAERSFLSSSYSLYLSFAVGSFAVMNFFCKLLLIKMDF